MIKYRDIEIDITQCNFTDDVAIIPLNGEIVCLPLEDATAEELEIIQAIRDDVEGRPIPEPVMIAPIKTEFEILKETVDALVLASLEV
jgi:hypothetical protein